MFKRLRKHLNIYWLFFLGMSVLAVMLIVLQRHKQYDAALMDMMVRAKSIAEFAYPSLSRQLNDELIKSLGTVSEMLKPKYLLVTDNKSSIIFSYPKVELYSSKIPKQWISTASDHPYERKFNDGDVVVESILPIKSESSSWNDAMGYVLLGYSKETILSPINSFSYLLLLIAGAGIVSILVLIMITNKKYQRAFSFFRKQVSFRADGDASEITTQRSDPVVWKGVIQDFNAVMRRLKTTEKELIKSNKIAAIGQSASMIAHDIRRPLTSLKSLTMLLPEKHDDPEFIQDFSKKVEESIDKTNSMLNEILEFSKDATSLEKSECDPQSIITSALSDVFTGKRDISIEVSYELRHRNYLDVDCHRIVRVITNIIGNAVEAMGGKGKIWIGTEEIHDVIPAKAGIQLSSQDSSLRWNDSKERRNDSAMMRIILGNNGPVIPEDVQKKLFDPFFTKGKKGGTGLGLAICQKIIEMHGGTIRVESRCHCERSESIPRVASKDSRLRRNDNDGRNDSITEFIIELPSSEGNLTVNEAELIHHSDEFKTFRAEDAVREQYGDSENTQEFMRLHKEHEKPFYLLIVDDEPLFRETVQSLLRSIPQVKDHVKVVECGNAEDAFKLFTAREFDYVISDIDMGRNRMNGYEMSRQLLEKYPNTFVLIHSNKRREELDIQLRGIASSPLAPRNDSRFMGFLPKPMKQSELLQFLAQKTFESPIKDQNTRAPEHKSTKSILILNDDDALSLSFKMLLKRDGVNVLRAADVDVALQRYKENKVDLILSDINLGEDIPDGYEFLKHVRRENKEIPFYMMSGYSKKEEEGKALQNGATGYLQLPVNKEQLLGLLE